MLGNGEAPRRGLSVTVKGVQKEATMAFLPWMFTASHCPPLSAYTRVLDPAVYHKPRFLAGLKQPLTLLS